MEIAYALILVFSFGKHYPTHYIADYPSMAECEDAGAYAIEHANTPRLRDALCVPVPSSDQDQE